MGNGTDSDRSGASWRPIPRTRAYEQVIARIEEQIVGGDLSVGDRLPAERDLAAMLEVSRAAVREAIRTLEAQGVLASGVGTDGGTFVTSLSSEALTRTIRLHVSLANFSMPDVLEARVMLERHSARLAAARHDAADLTALEEVLHRMADNGTTRDEYNDLDTRFHVLIAETSHNTLITDITTAVRESMRVPILDSFHASADWERRAEELTSAHRAIFTAIRDGDGAVAANTVERHIRSAYAQLQYHDR